MKRYCSIDGHWINPTTHEQDDAYIDDSACYPTGISPSLTERKQLNALTLKLFDLATVCTSYENMNFTKFSRDLAEYRNFRMIPRDEGIHYSIIFDGIVCFSSDSRFELTTTDIAGIPSGNCPTEQEFFSPTVDTFMVHRPYNYSAQNVDGYSLGWKNCLNKKYKDLLTKLGLDVFFKEGCAAFKNEYIDLPLTPLMTEVRVSCSNALTSVKSTISSNKQNNFDELVHLSPQMDPSKTATFYCNNCGEWFGTSDLSMNKDCFSDATKELLDNMVAYRQTLKSGWCPPIQDDIVDERWPPAVAGSNATLSCKKVLELMLGKAPAGLSTVEPTTTTSTSEWQASLRLDARNQNDIPKKWWQRRTIPEVKRLCNEKSEWEKVDWMQCFNREEVSQLDTLI